MEITGRIVQKLVLFSLAMLIVPMVAFPAQFGTQLARGSLITVLYELAYYGFVVYMLKRRGGLVQLMPAAGICLVYRLLMGALFGLTISALYSMDTRLSLTFGLSSYLPGILFHVALAPFVLKTLIDQYYQAVLPATRPKFDRAEPEGIEHGRTSLAVSKERGFVFDQSPQQPEVVRSEVESELTSSPKPVPDQPTSGDAHGFDRAVRYIGEHGSVHLAAVVDSEGLLLANYVRGSYDPEEWAPLALLFQSSSSRILARGRLGSPEKIDFRLSDTRLSVATGQGFSLMVISERQSDDVLGIRINQALEMIRKFVDERYSDKLNLNAESIHVRSAE